MLNNIKSNLNSFFASFKAEKVSNETIPKYLQLKYTFIPIAVIIFLTYCYIDTPVEQQIVILSPEYKQFFKRITDFGKADWMIQLAAIFLAIRLFFNTNLLKEPIKSIVNQLTTYTCFILSTIVIGGILGQLLKGIIGRGRPMYFLEHGSTYFEHFQHFFGYNFASMPSGHSLTLGSLFTCFVLLWPRLKYLWIVLAIFVASSRVFVGSHYPSDVIFGLCFGAYTSLFIYYWMKNRNLI